MQPSTPQPIKPKEIAIIGPSGCGKSKLSLQISHHHPCVILSLDSLSIYQHIDIASAKPTKKERANIPHFGLDRLNPTQGHNVHLFIEEYQRAKAYCQEHQMHLLIVGGTSFYLKILSQGISPLPKISPQTKQAIEQTIQNYQRQNIAYAELKRIDAHFAQNISPHDSYRIQKGLEIFLCTKQKPFEYFKAHPPKPILKNCSIYEIEIPKEQLQKQVALRTQSMLENGLINEASNLFLAYGTKHQWAKSIGLKECKAYLDGTINQSQLANLITTHTMQLAKRQNTFNKTQIHPKRTNALETTKALITQQLGS